MRSKQIVHDIMKQRGFTLERLANKLGYKTTSGVSERLRTGKRDMQIDVFLKMLEAMDCELIVRSTLKDKSEWEVTLDESNTNKEEC